MSTLSVWGELVACKDAMEIADVAAKRIAAAIEAKLRTQPLVSVALSGGTTPRETYARLALAKHVDWSKVLFFWVDERAVPPSDSRSNYHMVDEAMLQKIPVNRNNVARMQADLSDLKGAAESYESLLRARVAMGPNNVPQLDILTLGVGADGHTASLFPHDVALREHQALVTAVAPAPGREARLSLTFPVLLNASNVFVVASGSEKSKPLERAWAAYGDENETPLRSLRNATGSTTWIIDRAAGGLTR